jgi:hypothetical protein
MIACVAVIIFNRFMIMGRGSAADPTWNLATPKLGGMTPAVTVHPRSDQSSGAIHERTPYEPPKNASPVERGV